MLNSVVFFVLTCITSFFKLLGSLLGIDSLAAVLDAALDPLDKSSKKRQIIVPSHLAVVFVDQKCDYWNNLFDLILHSSAFGINRISLYDPGSVIKNNRSQFLYRLRLYLKCKNSKVYPIFEFETPPTGVQGQTYIHVSILGSDDGRGALIRACKKLAHQDREITAADIQSELADEYIFEPDLLLRIGAVDSLAGYPPWTLRVTEIVSISKFTEDSFPEAQFESVLRDFSSRDRRLGK